MSGGLSKRRDRQIVRVLGVLGTLLEGGHPSLHQLAARFHTRRETIYRDLKALADAGYPIAGDEDGRLSHPQLLERPRQAKPEVRLSDEEMQSLLWAARTAAPRGAFHEALASAAVKLRTMLAVRQNAPAAGFEDLVVRHDWGTKDYAPHQRTILSLVEAILRGHRCNIRYRSPARARPTAFAYDPYRLVHTQDGIYCLGQTPAYGGVTTLAVDRILAMTITAETFVVDPSFDARRYEADAFGVVWDNPMTVVVRFRADQAPYVRERLWHPSQQLRELADGGVELTLRAGGMFEISRWILSWGDAAQVLEPPELREHIRFTLCSAHSAYSEQSGA